MLVDPANTIDGQFLDSEFLDIKHVVLRVVICLIFHTMCAIVLEIQILFRLTALGLLIVISASIRNIEPAILIMILLESTLKRSTNYLFQIDENMILLRYS